MTSAASCPQVKAVDLVPLAISAMQYGCGERRRGGAAFLRLIYPVDQNNRSFRKNSLELAVVTCILLFDAHILGAPNSARIQ